MQKDIRIRPNHAQKVHCKTFDKRLFYLQVFERNDIGQTQACKESGGV